MNRHEPGAEAVATALLERGIGVEDTLLLPDGRPAADNAQLVRAAAAGPRAP
ncbi:hypothetical protein ACFZBG_24805 [Streptomyces lydicus]|uniref:hypothetical protein n=1 Tax=Streptomyces lydicus TaxID=47763 RepID=UPI0036E7AC14